MSDYKRLTEKDSCYYDKPKELNEFKMGCKGCKERDTYHCKFYCYGERPLTRPLQSYIHVKELTNE